MERAAIETVGRRIRELLQAEKRRIVGEIREYPRPIAACDLQFNALLEKRAGILRELERLDDAIEQCARLEDWRWLDELVYSTCFLDDETRQRLASGVGEGVDARA